MDPSGAARFPSSGLRWVRLGSTSPSRKGLEFRSLGSLGDGTIIGV